MGFFAPDVDTLPDDQINRGFICHCCGHPTADHLLGQKAFRLVCHHISYISKPIMREIQTGSVYVKKAYVYEEVSEPVQCDCPIELGTTDFETFHDKHLEFCNESQRRRILAECRNKL